MALQSCIEIMWWYRRVIISAEHWTELDEQIMRYVKNILCLHWKRIHHLSRATCCSKSTEAGNAVLTDLVRDCGTARGLFFTGLSGTKTMVQGCTRDFRNRKQSRWEDHSLILNALLLTDSESSPNWLPLWSTFETLCTVQYTTGKELRLSMLFQSDSTKWSVKGSCVFRGLGVGSGVCCQSLKVLISQFDSCIADIQYLIARQMESLFM